MFIFYTTTLNSPVGLPFGFRCLAIATPWATSRSAGDLPVGAPNSWWSGELQFGTTRTSVLLDRTRSGSSECAPLPFDVFTQGWKWKMCSATNSARKTRANRKPFSLNPYLITRWSMLSGFYWRIGPGGKLRRVIADVVISYQGCQSNLTFGRKVA